MALTRPLRLKRELVQSAPEVSTTEKPVARVWVDSGVFHLDESYDYLVPDNLDPHVSVGVRVQVPFNGRECEALVLERIAVTSGRKLKSITKVISRVPLASKRSLDLIALVATRWACHPYDVIRSAIPPRVASVEKKQWSDKTAHARSQSSVRQYRQLPPYRDPFQVLSDHVKSVSANGSILVLVPDKRSVLRLIKYLPQALVLDSDLPRSERYENFLRARTTSAQIIIGTRSAIFIDSPDLASIVIFNESSEQYFEIRSPGWNARDIAVLRARTENISIYCVGYSPSAEVARLIDIGWFDFKSAKEKVRVDTFQQEFSELLPGKIIGELRRLIKQGPILFIAPRKGYSQSISCNKCRNISICSCGGRLEKKGATTPISCSLCAHVYSEWACQYCAGVIPFLLNRGSERFAQEIGVALPGVSITLSEAEKNVEDFQVSSGIVIATPGSAPMSVKGYAAVVILDGENLLNQSDLRAQERAREIFFTHAALLSPSGSALLVINHANPIVGALASWKPSLISRRELAERIEASLPPFVRSISLDIDSVESATMVRALNKSRDEGRLPGSTRILGPSILNTSTHRILLLAPLEDGEALVLLIHEFQRRRSATRKKLATLRIDPYSLSR
ncbi:PriA Primosomal protein N' (replication factor Y) - superfamily II helicase [Candidatus Nanopelagicaceae bacterium]